MSGKYLLDTNIVIAIFNGEEKLVKKIEKLNGIFVPNIVIGELYYGAMRSGKKSFNLKKIETFIWNTSILSTNVETAKHYGIIKNDLKKKGKPIPENDVWIAALSKQYNLKILTKDKHFKEISELSVKIFSE